MPDLPTLSDRHRDHRRYPPGVAYMDGQYLPMSEAKISVLDYGFLHSDATYDVVHVWDGAFFRLGDHLDRFFAGLDRLHMSLPYSAEEIAEILHNCVALSGLRRAYVEFICTRGMSESFSRDPRDATNRFIAFAIPFGSVANEAQMEVGLHAAIAPITRIPPSSVDPRIKNYHWLDLIEGLYYAYDQGAETAILLDQEGLIAEGPGFNVFALSGSRVVTPASGVLQGITRQSVFDLCLSLGLDCQAAPLSREALTTADEVFITSTAGGIMPITQIDGRPIGDGRPGPQTQALRAAYWALHAAPEHRFEVHYPTTD